MEYIIRQYPQMPECGCFVCLHFFVPIGATQSNRYLKLHHCCLKPVGGQWYGYIILNDYIYILYMYICMCMYVCIYIYLCTIQITMYKYGFQILKRRFPTATKNDAEDVLCCWKAGVFRLNSSNV